MAGRCTLTRGNAIGCVLKIQDKTSLFASPLKSIVARPWKERSGPYWAQRHYRYCRYLAAAALRAVSDNATSYHSPNGLVAVNRRNAFSGQLVIFQSRVNWLFSVNPGYIDSSRLSMYQRLFNTFPDHAHKLEISRILAMKLLDVLLFSFSFARLATGKLHLLYIYGASGVSLTVFSFLSWAFANNSGRNTDAAMSHDQAQDHDNEQRTQSVAVPSG
jgi:hypothetical protein